MGCSVHIATYGSVVHRPGVDARQSVPGSDAAESVALAVRLQRTGRMLQDELQELIWQAAHLGHFADTSLSGS